jgi:ATP-dependent RNA helicase RhlE
MKFSDYPLADSIKEQLSVIQFNRPTDIQHRVIPHILDGEDVMAVAQTGTGKTAAFVIPLLQRVWQNKQNKIKGLQCLVMVPTRELSRQIAEQVQLIGKRTGIRSFGLYGGIEQDEEMLKIGNKLDWLVTTPGRMFDLMHRGIIHTEEVRFLVLDEADLMLDLGFQKDIYDVLRKIDRKPQTLFFTATINKKIKSVAYDVVKNAIRIQISPKNPVAKTIDHAVAFVEMDDKRFFLESILKTYEDKRILVFVRTKVRAERVQAAMSRVQLSAEFLHGGLDQQSRFDLLDRFRNGENKALITTDVSARGIDIPNVDYVVNYDLPDNPENYVHRCGRTGRGNKRGQALSLCSEGEKKLLLEIEKYTGKEIDRYEIPKDDYDAIRFDSDDPEYNWKKLLEEANQRDGSADEW